MSLSRTKKAALLTFSKVLLKSSPLVIAAVLSRIFTKPDYATYKQTILVFLFLSPVMKLGLEHSLFYFIPKDKEKSRSTLTGNLLLLFISASLLILFLWGGGARLIAAQFNNPKLSELILLYSPYILISMLLFPLNSCLICFDKIKTLISFNITQKISALVLIVCFALIWRTPKAAILGTVLASCIFFIPGILFMYKPTPKGEIAPSSQNMLKQLKYCIPIGLAGIIATMSVNLDKIIVSSMCSLDQFAIYVNGAIQIPLFSTIVASATSILTPEFAMLHKEKNYPKILSLWRGATIKCTAIILPFLFLLFAMAPELIEILFSAKYSQSSSIFRIYLLMFFVRVTSFNSIIAASGKTKFIFIYTILSFMINIILSIFFVSFWGPYGAAVGTIIATYFYVTCQTFTIHKILGIKLVDIFPTKKYFTIFFICLLASTVSLLNKFIPEIALLRISLITPVYFCAVLLLFKFFKITEIKDILSNIFQTNSHNFN